MGAPKIGHDVQTESTTPIMGYQMDELERSLDLGVVPMPPKIILDRIQRENKEFRWMSPGQVKHRGMRGYTALSLTEKEREWLRDHGGMYGVYAGAENTLKCRDDQFLAVISRDLKVTRDAMKARRTIDQTKLAKEPLHRETIERAGGKVISHSVEEWTQQGE